MQIREDYNEVDCRLIAKEVKQVHAELSLCGQDIDWSTRQGSRVSQQDIALQWEDPRYSL